MNSALQVTQSAQGWIIEMTPEIAAVAGVDVRSLILLNVEKDLITTTIIPPLDAELERFVDDTIDSMSGAFAEIKRHGD